MPCELNRLSSHECNSTANQLTAGELLSEQLLRASIKQMVEHEPEYVSMQSQIYKLLYRSLFPMGTNTLASHLSQLVSGIEDQFSIPLIHDYLEKKGFLHTKSIFEMETHCHGKYSDHVYKEQLSQKFYLNGNTTKPLLVEILSYYTELTNHLRIMEEHHPLYLKRFHPSSAKSSADTSGDESANNLFFINDKVYFHHSPTYSVSTSTTHSDHSSPLSSQSESYASDEEDIFSFPENPLDGLEKSIDMLLEDLSELVM